MEHDEQADWDATLTLDTTVPCTVFLDGCVKTEFFCFNSY